MNASRRSEPPSSLPPPPRPVEEIARGLRRASSLHVLVVGDFFVDQYVEGVMFEISKEGPIPVIREESRLTAAGAAGNLASSIRNLGAQVLAAGVIGDDLMGEALVAELEAKGIDTSGFIVRPGTRTFTYTKIRARVENAPSQEVLRLDVLPGGPLPAAVRETLLERIRERLSAAGAVVVLDQVDHVVTPELLEALPPLARRHGIHLQGSSRDHLASFHDFDLVIPNDVEARGAAGGDAGAPGSIDLLGRELKRRGRHRQILLTLGPEGMALFPEDETMSGERLPSFATEVVDVTGAGDAVSSAAVVGSLLGWDLRTIAWTASHAAAVALRHVGTHHVSRGELEEEVLSCRSD